jgi:hypothetical protein
MNICPDCKNSFVQPFKCITCGAEKLYDATVRSQAERIERLERAGDVLAHSLSFPAYERELSAWWNLRGGVDACTVCNPAESSLEIAFAKEPERSIVDAALRNIATLETKGEQ